MNPSDLQLNAPPEARDDEPLAAQIMSNTVVAITADSDLIVAARLMAGRGVRHLPVMEGNRCCGLLLETDVLQALATADNPLVRPPLLAAQLCRPAPTVEPGERRAVAAQRMQEAGTDAVVVVATQTVVGILTATDLVRSLAAEVTD